MWLERSAAVAHWALRWRVTVVLYGVVVFGDFSVLRVMLPQFPTVPTSPAVPGG